MSDRDSNNITRRRMILKQYSEKVHLGREYEKIITALYTSIVTEGDTVVDCGARRGDHTFPLAELVGRSGRVYAFEPYPGDLENLRAIAVKKTIANRIVFSASAVSNASGTSEFFCCEGLPGHSGLVEKKNYPYECTIKKMPVDVTTLDDIVREDNVTFIKLDIEGAEFPAMMGAAGIIARCRPTIIFENAFQNSATMYSYTKEDFFNFFNKHGYVIHDILGLPIDESLWRESLMTWNFIASPKEKGELTKSLLDIAQDASRVLFPRLLTL